MRNTLLDRTSGSPHVCGRNSDGELGVVIDDDRDPLRGRLVQEFLGMLADEGLVPMKPLADEELRELWERSWLAVGRFHEFFGACRDEIAGALNMAPGSKSRLDPGYIWQDFVDNEGGRIVA